MQHDHYRKFPISGGRIYYDETRSAELVTDQSLLGHFALTPQVSTKISKRHFHSLPLDKVSVFDSKYVAVQCTYNIIAVVNTNYYEVFPEIRVASGAYIINLQLSDIRSYIAIMSTSNANAPMNMSINIVLGRLRAVRISGKEGIRCREVCVWVLAIPR